MTEFSAEKIIGKKVKQTKRTEVAKDVLEKSEYTGKDVFDEKPVQKQEAIFKKFNNIISLDEFSDKDVIKTNKPTKRTDNSKDVLLEKKKAKVAKEDSKPSGLTAGQKKLPLPLQNAILKRKGSKPAAEKDDKKEVKAEPKKGLTAGQKRLPPALQAAILKKQGK